MPHHNVTLQALLLQLATLVRDLCQRQIDKSRLLDNLNLDAIVNGLLREHGLELDFDQQFGVCINAMSQDDALGQTLVFDRCHGRLRMREVEALSLADADASAYEMVLFDGGNTHGDRWKHVFFPAQRVHHFVYEDD